MLTAVTNTDFVMCEKTAGGYVPHLFRSQAQYQAWFKVKRPGNMLHRTQTHGRMYPAIDHRKDIEDDC